MSANNVHKVSVALPAASYEDASKHQTAARHWAQHRLPELLDQYLATLQTGDEVVYIERVAISLPDYPWNLSEADWQQQLTGAIRLSAASGDSLIRIAQQWLFYLAHGCLQARALLNTRQEIEDFLLKQLGQLKPVLLKETGGEMTLIMWQRLVTQHSEALVVQVLGCLLDIAASVAEALYPILLNKMRETPGAVYLQLSALTNINRGVQAGDKAALLRQILKDTPPMSDQKKPADSKTKTDRKPDTDQTPAAKEAITCYHAGLVLLLPYINRYFENTGLVANEAFVSVAARNRGIRALHWLATGALELPPEEQLVLPKLLCGVDLSDTVSWEDVWPVVLQDEGQALLEAVIGYWQVLQHTSVEGLRQTFLQRNGQLHRRNEQYVLRVEESGVDILLNSIPWGFRNYRLPWMHTHLITEWH